MLERHSHIQKILNTVHWQIQGGTRDTYMPSLSPLSFKGLDPPLHLGLVPHTFYRGNPGSATAVQVEF